MAHAKKVTVKKVKSVFQDARGKIFDLVEDAVNHVGLITSCAGSVRGNHYHKRSTQYTYMISGKIQLVTKDARAKNTRVKKVMMTAGDVAIIPPWTIHTYRAIANSAFIDCTSASRKKKGYEEDTMRVDSLV